MVPASVLAGVHYDRERERERDRERDGKNVTYFLVFPLLLTFPACSLNLLIQTLSELSAHIRMLKEPTAPQNSYSCFAYSKCPHTYIPHVVTSLRGPPHSDVMFFMNMLT